MSVTGYSSLIISHGLAPGANGQVMSSQHIRVRTCRSYQFKKIVSIKLTFCQPYVAPANHEYLQKLKFYVAYVGISTSLKIT